jgi:hypothetical protein
MATVYSIVVRGRLTDRLATSFEGMAIQTADGTTILTGSVRDQSHLMGILQTIASLGLELISAAPDPKDL